MRIRTVLAFITILFLPRISKRLWLGPYLPIHAKLLVVLMLAYNNLIKKNSIEAK